MIFQQLAIAIVMAAFALQSPAVSNALRIVVISGEDAINIIQQKTAVNPIVEVRDRNNLPVSGVAVTFSVGGQGASFAGGASTLTLTTNAAGQAVVTGLTPTATGAITINASAVVNGQTIAATITQTNFATAAEAAASASAGGAGSTGGASGSGGGATGGGTSGAAGGAGGGIGGLSGATLGIVGGGIAAAGAVVATQAGGGSDAPAVSTGTSGGTATTPTTPAPTTPAPTTPAPTTPTSQTFNGPVSITLTDKWTSSFGGQVIHTCTATLAKTGSLRIILTTQTGGTVTGTGQMLSLTTRITSLTCSDGTQVPLPNTDFGGANGILNPITGTTGSLRFQEDVNITDTTLGETTTVRGTTTFTGSLSGGVITGTLTDTFTTTSDGELTVRGTSSSSTPVTLR